MEVKNNLTATEMVRYLQDQADKHKYKQVDCFVCCILTHAGDQGKLFGVDGKVLNILEATSVFKGLRCPSLIGKPKVFFIQACQRSERQGGAPYTESDDVSIDVLQRTCTIPDEADFLLGYSTVSGFESYRHSIQGSWYFQTLTAMIDKYSSSLDLPRILIRVNDEISKKVAGRERYKQIPAPLFTLRKDLYFK